MSVTGPHAMGKLVSLVHDRCRNDYAIQRGACTSLFVDVLGRSVMHFVSYQM